MRFAIYATVLALLSPFLTGCVCTRFTNKKVGYKCFDVFCPSAVYRKESPVSFALEGTRVKRGQSFHAFLIIGNDLLAGANVQTNQTLTVEDIHRTYDLIFIRQETPSKLPPDYARVAVLPKNDLHIQVDDYYPGQSWGYLLPFAVLADVATFPVQVICWACGAIDVPM